MSQAVLNNSQATGHTDLLSGILKVQVRNEEKITEQDRIYCQNQQDELYKTLDQIAWWYNIFKREAENMRVKSNSSTSRTVRLPQAAMTSTIATIMTRRIIPITSLLLSRTSMSWWIAVITLSETLSTASSAISITPTVFSV